MNTATEPRRLTPTERLHEVTMSALARRPAEPESSVTISRNAKGVAQFDVTVRGADVAACHTKAQAIYDTLVAAHQYPVSENGGAA